MQLHNTNKHLPFTGLKQRYQKVQILLLRGYIVHLYISYYCILGLVIGLATILTQSLCYHLNKEV